MNYDDFEMKDRVAVSISRTTSNNDKYPEFISIEIMDEKSRCQVVSVKMSLEDFARCISSCQVSNLPAEFPSARTKKLLGKKMENKEEYLPILSYENFAEVYKREAKKFEVDGWIADTETSHNFHRRMQNGYRAIFRRWI